MKKPSTISRIQSLLCKRRDEFLKKEIQKMRKINK